MRTRECEFDLLPGFCALMRPGGVYDAGHDEGNRLGITFIHFECVGAGRGRVWRGWPEFFGVRDAGYRDAVMRRVVELFASEPEAGALLLRALVADLLRQPSSCEPFSVHRERILRVTSAVYSAERLPTVALMAEQVHLSSAHFSRIFRRVMGQSPMEFLLQARLSRARHLLLETSLNISEIAARLDYVDVFFFSRQFKEKCGLAPSDFRARAGRVPAGFPVSARCVRR
jgi:AraC-like DNA-binding protein